MVVKSVYLQLTWTQASTRTCSTSQKVLKQHGTTQTHSKEPSGEKQSPRNSTRWKNGRCGARPIDQRWRREEDVSSTSGYWKSRGPVSFAHNWSHVATHRSQVWTSLKCS